MDSVTQAMTRKISTTEVVVRETTTEVEWSLRKDKGSESISIMCNAYYVLTINNDGTLTRHKHVQSVVPVDDDLKIKERK